VTDRLGHDRRRRVAEIGNEEIRFHFLELARRHVPDMRDAVEIIERREWSVLVAIAHDRLGARLSDSLHRRQLHHMGRVDVDLGRSHA